MAGSEREGGDDAVHEGGKTDAGVPEAGGGPVGPVWGEVTAF